MKKIKSLIAPFLFLLAVLAGICLTNLLLYPSNEITQNWQAFYALAQNSVDILIVGSSHAYSTFDLEAIQQETGKTPYLIASPSQSVQQSYFNVKEALHTQRPQLLVLEAFSLGTTGNVQVVPQQADTSQQAEQSQQDLLEADRDWAKVSNIDGMHMGLTKVEAILTQFRPGNWFYAFAKIQRSHDNWKRIDYLWKNIEFMRAGIYEFNPFMPSVTSMQPETMQLYAEAEGSTEVIRINEESKQYFHKLAQLCRDEGITLCLIMAPMYDQYIASLNYDSWHEELVRLAEEENIRYIDCNILYDEIGLTAQDFEDAYTNIHHLNGGGARKVSLYISEELGELYEKGNG